MNEEQAAIAAGLFDGDGCVILENPTKKNPRQTPELQVSQSYNKGEPPELKWFQGVFQEGNIHLKREVNGAVRKQWELNIQSTGGVTRVVNALLPRCIIKRPQLQAAAEYLTGGCVDMSVAPFLKALKTGHHDVEIDPERITIPYVAGLFAAEGTVGLYAVKRSKGYRLKSTIAQNSCIPLLHAIKKKMGIRCTVHSGYLAFGPRATFELLSQIQPYLPRCQKRRQVRIVLDWYNDRTDSRTLCGSEKEEQFAKTEEVAKKLKTLKRR